jgi:hypothetical protein
MISGVTETMIHLTNQLSMIMTCRRLFSTMIVAHCLNQYVVQAQSSEQLLRLDRIKRTNSSQAAGGNTLKNPMKKKTMNVLDPASSVSTTSKGKNPKRDTIIRTNKDEKFTSSTLQSDENFLENSNSNRLRKAPGNSSNNGKQSSGKVSEQKWNIDGDESEFVASEQSPPFVGETSPEILIHSPNNTVIELPQDLPPPEDGFLPIGDMLDKPNIEDSLPSEMSTKERIPLQHTTTTTTTTNKSSNNGRSGVLRDDEIPMVLPLGERAESMVLHHTASVCATHREEAEQNCATLPLCKFLPIQGKDGTTKISTTLASGQTECIRRCDSPHMSDNHCGPYQTCFRFVMGCQCTKLSWDGGDCQPM